MGSLYIFNSNYKNIFLCLVFISIFFIGDRVGGYAISTLIDMSNHNIAKLYSNKQNGEIILIGNSRAKRTFDLGYLENRFGKKVVNLTGLGDPTPLSLAYLLDYIDQGKIPEIIIMESSNLLSCKPP